MPSFFKKTLAFLGFIDEDIGENNEIELKDNFAQERRDSSNRHRTKAYRNERNLQVYSDEAYKDKEVNHLQSKQPTSWFKSSKKIASLEEAKMEKKFKVFVIEPNTFENSQVIGDKFKSDIPVIVNLQNESQETSKRIIDFCSGLTYALNGSIEKVADKVFLITPYNVEVTSEEKELLREKGFYEEL